MKNRLLERLAVIVPAYNPDKNLLGLVDDLLERGFGWIIVLNDGSSPSRSEIFDALGERKNVSVICHAINLGKGRALKTAFNWFLCHKGEFLGVITADADGQHAPYDIVRIGEALLSNDTFVLGVRDFPASIPLRSRVGNLVTRYIMSFLYGRSILDTQTGLRGIPLEKLPRFMSLTGERYEYETSMLIDMFSGNAEIQQIKIDTIYIDNNRSSHFNPVLDSMRIYFTLLRFFSSSVLTTAIDFLAFWSAYGLFENTLVALAAGRACGIFFNFVVNKRFVFKDRRPSRKALFRYCLVVAVFFNLSYFLIEQIVGHSSLGPVGAKVLAESLLFFLSFSVQRIFVFSRTDLE